MTDESGTVVWSGTYYPFGEAATGSGNTHQFTGKEYDSEMSLNYFCQRYYDPEIGRFMSLDPQDSPASSPYAYCANNPLKFIDPTGEAAWNDLSERMEINADFWGNYHPTGWGNPGGWKYYHSAQMDPDFWSPGWDWSAGANDLVRQAMFILSSGIFEWDLLTVNGWQHINIGDWLKANNLHINIVAGMQGGSIDAFGGAVSMDIGLGGVGNVYDLAALITHEATHLLAKEGGIRFNKKEEAGALLADIIDDGLRNFSIVTATRKQHELWATGMMFDFENLMSPNFRQGVINYLQLYRNNQVWRP